MIEELSKTLFEIESKGEKGNRERVCRDALIAFLKELRLALFNAHFCDDFSQENLLFHLSSSYTKIKDAYGESFDAHKDRIDTFYKDLPAIREKLMKDVQAFYDGDPAANDKEEIVVAYPGFTAIFCYRVAHEFYLKGDKKTARLISEYAHSRTGIDIHPGATIGDSFFIDHGTGIVIGETAVIGNNCKLYQGVTLGALSLKNGRKLIGKKRHPTLLNNVVIYSGASIFGGDTIIGNNVTVGSNVEIKESIPDGTIVRGNCGNQ
ncbi:MAG: serine acetyltransferase [Bacilli bacterium]|nr:serine acetyltransferase [Bacilli bacterium]